MVCIYYTCIYIPVYDNLNEYIPILSIVCICVDWFVCVYIIYHCRGQGFTIVGGKADMFRLEMAKVHIHIHVYTIAAVNSIQVNTNEFKILYLASLEPCWTNTNQYTRIHTQ